MKPEEALGTAAGLPSKAWLRETLIPAWIDRAVRPGHAGFVEMFDPTDPDREPGTDVPHLGGKVLERALGQHLEVGDRRRG